MRNRGGLFGIIVPSLTIAVFAILLAFSFMRLSAIDRHMRIEMTQNMLWVISRAQVSSLELKEAVTYYSLGQADQKDIDQAFNIFLGQFNTLNSGPQRRYMNRLHLSATLDKMDRARPHLAVLTTNIAVDHARTAIEIHQILEPYETTLARAANMAMVAEWNDLGSKLDSFRSEIATILLSLLIISLAGIGMTVHLVRATRNVHLRTRLLERERTATDMYRNFAAMVSHQFRTPLAIVDSTLQRLIRRADSIAPTDLVERCTQARAAIARLVYLVESTLDAARMDAGQIGKNAQPCDLHQVAREALRRQRDETPERIFILSRTAPGFALCDPVHTEHIIVNLLSNAAKYAPPSTAIHMNIHVTAGQACCTVSNDGKIEAQDQENLFNRYFRGVNGKARDGIGIGLYMARSVDCH